MNKTVESLNPWQSIWTRPRATMTFLKSTGNHRYADLLFFIGGSAYGLNKSINSGTLEGFGLPFDLIYPTLIGGLGGLIMYNLLAWTLFESGKWLKGKGNLKQVKTAFAWAMAPGLLSMTLNFLGFFLYGESYLLFGEFDIGLSPTDEFVILGLYLSQFAVAALTLFIGVNTVSVAHQYHWGMSILNYIIALTLLLIPLILIFGLWGLLT